MKLKKYFNLKNEQKGAALILAAFILLSFSILIISYLQLIQINSKVLYLKIKSHQAYYAARAGMEDAIYELNQGHVWDKTNLNSLGGDLDIEWQHDGVSSDTTLYKGNNVDIAEANRISHFDYPVTFSVTISYDDTPSTGTINITSTGFVGDNIHTAEVYERKILTKAVRTNNEEMYILEMKEI